MRSVFTVLATVVAILAMIVVPSMTIARSGVVSPGGFAERASDAAKSTEVQDYFADNITAKIEDLVTDQSNLPGFGAFTADQVRPLVDEYVHGPTFISDFMTIATQQHAWLFDAPPPGTDPHVMTLNVTPMVANAIEQQFPEWLSSLLLPLDATYTVEVEQSKLTAGKYESFGTAVTWISWVSLVLTIVCGLAALILARRRLLVVAWLGGGAILSGIAGLIFGGFVDDRLREAVRDSETALRELVTVLGHGLVDDLRTASVIMIVAGVVVAAAAGFGHRRLERRLG